MDNIKVLTLDSIATLKSLIDSGGGSGILYNEYGTNTDGSLTQAFVSKKLNGQIVALGEGATANLTSNGAGRSVVIGYNATDAPSPSSASLNQAVLIGANAGRIADSSTSASNAIAIGRNAKASDYYGIAIGQDATANAGAQIAIGDSAVTSTGTQYQTAIGHSAKTSSYGAIALGSFAQASTIRSVSLGYGARSSRDTEVSIGWAATTSPNTYPASRYLANVTAGALDTDATNVAQVRSAVQGTTLYEGTASVNTLELAETASSFAYLQVICEYTGMGSTAIPQTVTVNFYPTETAKSFQVTATDLTVGDTPMVTTLQDIWMLSDDGIDLDLVSSTKAEQGAESLTCTPDTTSQFTIVKVIGFGKV